MKYTESDLLPLSALQHLIFCPRQCALIHLEQVWAENVFTAEGRIMHERVHGDDRVSRGAVRLEFGVPLKSLALGVTGTADVVEFHQTDKAWTPFPVEHKRGGEKKDNADKVQLCAQAMCLEEMLHLEVEVGALFYGKKRRRLEVVFTDVLRDETERVAADLHELISLGKTPAPVYSKKCDTCSLRHLCLPKTCTKAGSVGRYLSSIIKEI